MNLKALEGRRVVHVAPMTPDDIADMGWLPGRGGGHPIKLTFDDGTIIVASRDAEGNGPGALLALAIGPEVQAHPAEQMRRENLRRRGDG